MTIRVLNKRLGRLRNNVALSKGLPDSSYVAPVDFMHSYGYTCNTISYIAIFIRQ